MVIDRELRIHLLGGFRVEWQGKPIPQSAWLRRGAARTLVKLVALEPTHQLHREQILEMIWPDSDPVTARNSWGKALHAARRALEPTLTGRGQSSYLLVSSAVLALDTNRVWIDVDDFETLAMAALRNRDKGTLRAALGAYAGDLLPEDRYDDWAAAPRERLAALAQRLRISSSDVLEADGELEEAIKTLHDAVTADPIDGEANRKLIRLYALSGNRYRAERQYQAYSDVLMEELGVEPDAETEALYKDVRAGRFASAAPAVVAPAGGQETALPPVAISSSGNPLVGRKRVRAILLEELQASEAGNGRTVLIGGEAGVGKTRLMRAVVETSVERGALALWGNSYTRAGLIPYGPVIEALDGYLAGLTSEARAALAQQFPVLGSVVPSLASIGSPEPSQTHPGVLHGRLSATIISLLTQLQEKQLVVLALDDLHLADEASLLLLHQLARLAPARRWLIIATQRDEDVQPGSGFQRFAVLVTREELARRIMLGRLGYETSDALVRTLLPGGNVDPNLLRRLYQLSLGNPLFLQELVRVFVDDGSIFEENQVWRASPSMATIVPRKVRDLVTMRIDQLSPGTQRLLSLAAIAGMEWSFRELEEAAREAFGTALGDEAALQAMEEAIAAGILEEKPGTRDQYTFRHPLYQAALYERVPTFRAARIHAVVARTIERLHPENVDALNYHYGAAGESNRTKE